MHHATRFSSPPFTFPSLRPHRRRCCQLLIISHSKAHACCARRLLGRRFGGRAMAGHVGQQARPSRERQACFQGENGKSIIRRISAFLPRANAEAARFLSASWRFSGQGQSPFAEHEKVQKIRRNPTEKPARNSNSVGAYEMS